MGLRTKEIIIALLGGLFLVSLIVVQWMEVVRRREEAGLVCPHVVVQAASKACVDCHAQSNPGIISHWMGSTHALKGVGCIECHQANKEDADSFEHYGARIATRGAGGSTGVQARRRDPGGVSGEETRS